MQNKLSFNLLTTKIIIFTVAVSAMIGLAQSDKNSNEKTNQFGFSLKNKVENKRDQTTNPKKSADNLQSSDVIRIETTLVVAEVLVLDAQGRKISNLKKDDFVVIEDGEKQSIERLSIGSDSALPRSIVLIVDTSGCGSPFFRRRIEASLESAKLLVNKLNPQDRMAIVSDKIKLLQNFTGSKELLTQKLNSLTQKEPGGNWLRGHGFQYSALMAVLNEMFDENTARPIVIFQTEGSELAIMPPAPPSLPNNLKAVIRNFDLEAVYAAAEKSQATIYTVIPNNRYLGLSEAEQLKKAYIELQQNELGVKAEFSLKGINVPTTKLTEALSRDFAQNSVAMQSAVANLAKVSGGWTDFIEQPEQADKIYSAILSDINNRYIISYYPTNTARDGKRRIIRLAVQNHPEYTVWGRQTYLAARD